MNDEILKISARIDRAADRLRFSGREQDAELCSAAALRVRSGATLSQARQIETDLMSGMMSAVLVRLVALSGSGEYDAPDPTGTPTPTPGPTPDPSSSTSDPGTDSGTDSGTPTPEPGPTPDSQSGDGQQEEDQQQDDHFTLKDDSISLTDEAQSTVGDIANSYFKETGEDLTVTSGSRDTGEQAQAMFDKLEQGSTLSEYKDQDAAGEIKDAYEQAKQDGKSNDEIVADMQAVIDQQVADGTFISNHLKDGAVDIRSNDMTDEEKQSFIDSVTKITGKPPLVEGIPPHFHVDLGTGDSD